MLKQTRAKVRVKWISSSIYMYLIIYDGIFNEQEGEERKQYSPFPFFFFLKVSTALTTSCPLKALVSVPALACSHLGVPSVRLGN